MAKVFSSPTRIYLTPTLHYISLEQIFSAIFTCLFWCLLPAIPLNKLFWVLVFNFIVDYLPFMKDEYFDLLLFLPTLHHQHKFLLSYSVLQIYSHHNVG